MHDGTARVKLNGEPVNQMARIGTFSEYVVCPAEQVVAVRKDLPWTHAAIIGCSVATGVGAVIRHANVEAGSSVLVVGCGGVGLNVVQGAKLAGARTIIACDLLDNKLGYAREFGATHTINAKTEDVVKRVQELTDGFGADYAFDAIGGEKTAVLVVDAIAAGGHAVLVGIPAFAARAPVSPSAMVYGEKKLTGTYYGSIRPAIDFAVLADLDMDKRIDLDSLISRTYKFDEINEGFRLLMTGAVARGVITFLGTRCNKRSGIALLSRETEVFSVSRRTTGAIRLAPTAPYGSHQHVDSPQDRPPAAAGDEPKTSPRSRSAPSST